jgi:hypothetical protein
MAYEFDRDMRLPQWLARFTRRVTNRFSGCGVLLKRTT